MPVQTSDVTIVIPVKDDPLIYRCIESVDQRCDIVVASNGSPMPFLMDLRARALGRFRLAVLEEPGIGAAYNAGIAASKTDWILLMDSDCVFKPGALAALFATAGSNVFVKGRVEFQHDDWASWITAGGRRHLEDTRHTGRSNAYSPPLLYRRDVVSRMGGYHFDARMKWREDRDFELRRRSAGLEVTYEPMGVITHKRLTIREDLRSVRNYGTAQWSGEQLGLLPRLRARHEVTKVWRMSWRVAVQAGPFVSAYAVLRYVVLWSARLSARTKSPVRG